MAHPVLDRAPGEGAVCIREASDKALLGHPDLAAHEVRVYDSRGRTLVLGVACAALALGSLGWVVTEPAAIWAWLGLVLFGGCTWLWFARLRRPEPSLVVGPRGIGVMTQETPWEIVARVGHYEQFTRGGCIDWLTVFTLSDPHPGEAVEEDLRRLVHSRGRVVRLLAGTAAAGIGRLRSAKKSMAGGADVLINIDRLALTPQEALRLVGCFFAVEPSHAAAREHTGAGRSRHDEADAGVPGDPDAGTAGGGWRAQLGTIVLVVGLVGYLAAIEWLPDSIPLVPFLGAIIAIFGVFWAFFSWIGRWTDGGDGEG
jgi:hypothetical protein